MKTTVKHGVEAEPVRKAVDYLYTYHKDGESASSELHKDPKNVLLILNLWKNRKNQEIVIPVPHEVQSKTGRICVVVHDEPNMSPEETEEYYRNLLKQHGVTRDIEVTHAKNLKAKTGVQSMYLGLVDSRIYSNYPSFLKKHFYRKRVPLPIDLKSKDLSAELDQLIQRTHVYLSTPYDNTIQVGDMSMPMEVIVDNVLATAQVLAEKLPMKWKSVRSLSLYAESHVTLPIYDDLSPNLEELGLAEKERKKRKRNKVEDQDEKDGAPREKKVALSPSEVLAAKEKRKYEVGSKHWLWYQKYRAMGKPKKSKKSEDQVKEDTAAPEKQQNGENNTETETVPQVPKSKKRKNKKTDVQKTSEAEAEDAQVSSPKKPTPKKQKMNGTQTNKQKRKSTA